MRTHQLYATPYFTIRKILIAVLFLATLVAGSQSQRASAAPIVLFNSCSGEIPIDSPWNWDFKKDGGTIGFPAHSAVIQHVFTNTVLFDTAVPNTDRAGYAFTADTPFPTGMVLDRSKGFALSFNFQILNEIHTNNDSAGFSIVVLTDDNWGIEFGFWNDTIFAKDENQKHAEEVSYNNREVIQNYTLSVWGDSYCMFAPGISEPLIGKLRRYSPTSNSFNSYDETNYIFMGDNSTTASSQVYMTQAGYSFVGGLFQTSVPEPSPISIALLGAGMAAAFWLRSRKQA